jgi:hypothetical protein
MTSMIDFEEKFTRPEVELLRQVAKAIQSIRYGSVTIIVHDGRVTEVQRNEKLRIKNDESK